MKIQIERIVPPQLFPLSKESTIPITCEVQHVGILIKSNPAVLYKGTLVETKKTYSIIAIGFKMKVDIVVKQVVETKNTNKIVSPI